MPKRSKTTSTPSIELPNTPHDDKLNCPIQSAEPKAEKESDKTLLEKETSNTSEKKQEKKLRWHKDKRMSEKRLDENDQTSEEESQPAKHIEWHFHNEWLMQGLTDAEKKAEKKSDKTLTEKEKSHKKETSKTSEKKQEKKLKWYKDKRMSEKRLDENDQTSEEESQPTKQTEWRFYHAKRMQPLTDAEIQNRAIQDVKKLLSKKGVLDEGKLNYKARINYQERAQIYINAYLISYKYFSENPKLVNRKFTLPHVMGGNASAQNTVPSAAAPQIRVFPAPTSIKEKTHDVENLVIPCLTSAASESCESKNIESALEELVVMPKQTFLFLFRHWQTTSPTNNCTIEKVAMNKLGLKFNQ